MSQRGGKQRTHSGDVIRVEGGLRKTCKTAVFPFFPGQRGEKLANRFFRVQNGDFRGDAPEDSFDFTMSLFPEQENAEPLRGKILRFAMQ